MQDLNELRRLLECLSNEMGVSGRERAVRALIRSEIETHAERVEVDALGNLIAYKAGDDPEPRLKVLLSAHMDEVGFMISKIDKNGALRFRPIGGPEPRNLLAKRVVVGDQKIPGIIGAPPPHLQTAEQRNRLVDVDTMFIDIGASSDKDANGKVKVGDYATFATQFAVLSDDPAWPTVRGKAFDDRAGCAALISLLAERYPVDLVAVFTTQEESGLRGARVIGARTSPDAAFALEGTICDDLPQPLDEDRSPVTRLGAGAALSLMDRSMISHPGLLHLLERTAEAEGIPYQYRQFAGGGTEAGAIHTSLAGIPATTISTPCRYIHGPAAILNLNDLASVIRLTGAALRRIRRADLVRDA